MVRIGHGYDVHAFAEGRKCIIGGVDIPCEKGLEGHSDADVLAHAIADSLLGSVALGDIGMHFPDSDKKYKDANSLNLLKKVNSLVSLKGFRVVNVDATIIAQTPKMSPYIEEMRKNIARALSVDEDAVSVKATTEEGLGFTGNKEGIAVHCVSLVEK